MPHSIKRRTGSLNHTMNSWGIYGTWDGNIIDDSLQKIKVPYANFTIWSKPSFVKKIEFLFENEQIEKAVKLING